MRRAEDGVDLLFTLTILCSLRFEMRGNIFLAISPIFVLLTLTTWRVTESCNRAPKSPPKNVEVRTTTTPKNVQSSSILTIISPKPNSTNTTAPPGGGDDDNHQRLLEDDILIPETNSGRPIIHGDDLDNDIPGDESLDRWTGLWPNATIFYVIDTNFFDEWQQATIRDAMDEITQRTCIRFKSRLLEIDYLHIIGDSPHKGCWSSVGRQGGKQELNLDPTKRCLTHAIVLHALMYALGFGHEQARLDRDDFVKDVDVQDDDIASHHHRRNLKEQTGLGNCAEKRENCATDTGCLNQVIRGKEMYTCLCVHDMLPPVQKITKDGWICGRNVETVPDKTLDLPSDDKSVMHNSASTRFRTNGDETVSQRIGIVNIGPPVRSPLSRMDVTRAKLLYGTMATCKCTGFLCGGGNHVDDDGDGDECIWTGSRCDDTIHCKDQSDELNCENFECSPTKFKCKNGKCIDENKKCDGLLDCNQGEDERDCETCPSEGAYRCPNGQCIPASKRCDGVQGDCDHNLDEQNCNDCAPNAFKCDQTNNNNTCIKANGRCDGQPDCADGRDEINCVNCTENAFRCSNAQCVRQNFRCNGWIDCPDESDERNCLHCHSPVDTGVQVSRCPNGMCIVLHNMAAVLGKKAFTKCDHQDQDTVPSPCDKQMMNPLFRR